MKVSTEQHSIKVVFSLDEIEEFAGGGSETASSKAKIRNVFLPAGGEKVDRE